MRGAARVLSALPGLSSAAVARAPAPQCCAAEGEDPAEDLEVNLDDLPEQEVPHLPQPTGGLCDADAGR